MDLQSKIDRSGMIEVRRILEDISFEGGTYQWSVEKFDEGRDRQERLHWDMKVYFLNDSYTFRVQLKTTINSNPTIEVKHLYDWLSFNPNTILIVYFIETKMAFWTTPELLFACKSDLSELTYYTFNNSHFKALNVENREEFINHLKFIFGFKKKVKF